MLNTEQTSFLINLLDEDLEAHIKAYKRHTSQQARNGLKERMEKIESIRKELINSLMKNVGI